MVVEHIPRAGSTLGRLEVAAHFSFPKQVWHELDAAGRLTHHPVFPGKVGPAERRIASADDVDPPVRREPRC